MSIKYRMILTGDPAQTCEQAENLGADIVAIGGPMPQPQPSSRISTPGQPVAVWWIATRWETEPGNEAPWAAL